MLRIDLSSIAKGHGVDRICAKLEHLGFGRYFVEVGGEIRARGTKARGLAWTVAIELGYPLDR